MPVFMGQENSPNTTQNEAHNIHLGVFEACKKKRVFIAFSLSKPPVHTGFV